MASAIPSHTPDLPVSNRTSPSVIAGLTRVDGRRICRFDISGGPHHGAIDERAARAVVNLLRTAREVEAPVIGVLDTSGAEVNEGVTALHAWGSIAREMVSLSGVVPIVLVLAGPCVSGPALLLGLADAVVMTTDAFAYVSGPEAVLGMTGIAVDRAQLGGSDRHATDTGVAAILAPDAIAAQEAAELLLSYLPDHHLADPPRVPCDDPTTRECDTAAALVPTRASDSYDMREVISDIVDADSIVELRPVYAPNVITALARVEGAAVGILANQPMSRAGTLDIEASKKAARFVTWCDAFNIPIVTFVDTPGFEPGRDLEWRGMIRHGAELVHAYSAATVPRVCIVLRKAYGGAYIVMDSKGVGNDVCLAWPSAEIAVMGAAGAVQILHGRRLDELSDSDRMITESELVANYEAEFLNPYRAAERGLVDRVIAPAQTRRALASALVSLADKRDHLVRRKHSNPPQ